MSTPHPDVLAGARILLTREADDCSDWAATLRRAGAHPRVLPCIEVRSLPVEDDLSAKLEETDWLVFTSRRGVEYFASVARSLLPQKLRVAVVGPATAATAQRCLGRVDLEADPATAEGLAERLRQRLDAGARCLLALAENADDRLASVLEAAGAACRRTNLYRTLPTPPRQPRLPLSSLDVGHIFLASPSAVAGLLNQVERDAEVKVYSIGPSTSRAAREAGLNVTAEAVTPGLDGLIEAMQ